MLSFSGFTILFFLYGGRAWRVNRPIIGGEDCKMGEFPFIASLRNVMDGDCHECGCTILNSNWILTAAHCVDGASPEDFTVRYEFLRMSDPNPKVVNVAEIILHDEQDNYEFENDIALLRVEPDILFSDCVQPVVLPEKYRKIEDDTPATIIGWGIDENGAIPDALQKVDVLIASKSKCKELHGTEFKQTNLCAGSNNTGRDSCQGDSGGPLLLDSVQVGIISLGYEHCGYKPYAGIYTDLSYYIDWIVEIVAAHG